MSKTIVLPSGETSSEIHDASSVVNLSVRAGDERQRARARRGFDRAVVLRGGLRAERGCGGE